MLNYYGYWFTGRVYSWNKTWHWVERTYKATVISSRLRHSSVVPTVLPLASLAVRFATTGKPSHKQNLLKTSKTVETYNKCLVLKDLHSIKTLLFSHRSLRSLKLSPQLMFWFSSCYCVSGLIHFRHRVMRFTTNEVTWHKFPPLSFFLLGTSCLGRPSGYVPCASEDMACGYWFSKWRTTKPIWSDKKRRNRSQ